MHDSTRRTGSASSKWVPFRASMASSIRDWSHCLVSSTPSTASPYRSHQASARQGSPVPGSTFSASVRISASRRWNSAQP